MYLLDVGTHDAELRREDDVEPYDGNELELEIVGDELVEERTDRLSYSVRLSSSKRGQEIEKATEAVTDVSSVGFD